MINKKINNKEHMKKIENKKNINRSSNSEINKNNKIIASRIESKKNINRLNRSKINNTNNKLNNQQNIHLKNDNKNKADTNNKLEKDILKLNIKNINKDNINNNTNNKLEKDILKLNIKNINKDNINNNTNNKLEKDILKLNIKNINKDNINNNTNNKLEKDISQLNIENTNNDNINDKLKKDISKLNIENINKDIEKESDLFKKDFYKILDLPNSTLSTSDEIQVAYSNKVYIIKLGLEKKIITNTEARNLQILYSYIYNTLIFPKKRQKYDLDFFNKNYKYSVPKNKSIYQTDILKTIISFIQEIKNIKNNSILFYSNIDDANISTITEEERYYIDYILNSKYSLEILENKMNDWLKNELKIFKLNIDLNETKFNEQNHEAIQKTERQDNIYFESQTISEVFSDGYYTFFEYINNKLQFSESFQFITLPTVAVNVENEDDIQLGKTKEVKSQKTLEKYFEHENNSSFDLKEKSKEIKELSSLNVNDIDEFSSNSNLKNNSNKDSNSTSNFGSSLNLNMLNDNQIKKEEVPKEKIDYNNKNISIIDDKNIVLDHDIIDTSEPPINNKKNNKKFIKWDFSNNSDNTKDLNDMINDIEKSFHFNKNKKIKLDKLDNINKLIEGYDNE